MKNISFIHDSPFPPRREGQSIGAYFLQLFLKKMLLLYLPAIAIIGGVPESLLILAEANTLESIIILLTIISISLFFLVKLKRFQHQGKAINWSITDFINLELWLNGTDKTKNKQSKPPERELFLKLKANHATAKELTSRRYLFHHWLAEKQNTHAKPTAGASFVSILRWTATALFIIGFTGACCSLGLYFAWNQDRALNPDVNVTTFSLIFILLPFSITVLGLISTALGLLPSKLTKQIPGFQCLAELGFHGTLRVIQKIAKHLPTENSVKLVSLLGGLNASVKSRYKILSLCFALLIQSLSMGYAIGLPLAIYFNTKFVSHSFVWQTSYRSNPEQVYHNRATLAFPWSWLKGEGVGYPTLEQVKTTNHKKGSLIQDQHDSWAAWGTWLLFASLAYVTTIRFIALGATLLILRIKLRCEDFEDDRFDDLYKRMTTSYVNWTNDTSSENTHPQEAVELAMDKCLLAIPEDFKAEKIDTEIRRFLKTKKNWHITLTQFISEEKSGRAAFLNGVVDANNENKLKRIVLIDEASMPPVLERINFIKELRSKIGNTHHIVIALLGNHSDAPLGSYPSTTNLSVWEKELRRLADPRLQVISFTN